MRRDLFTTRKTLERQRPFERILLDMSGGNMHNHIGVITRLRGLPLHRTLIDALAVDDLSWQDYSNCRGADADLFFPERGASTRKAKAICNACEVQTECLEFAITQSEKFGIWGGLSERERRKIRKERSIAARIRRAS